MIILLLFRTCIVPDPPRALMVACPEKNAQDKTNVSWQEPRRLNGPGVVYRVSHSCSCTGFVMVIELEYCVWCVIALLFSSVLSLLQICVNTCGVCAWDLGSVVLSAVFASIRFGKMLHW